MHIVLLISGLALTVLAVAASIRSRMSFFSDNTANAIEAAALLIAGAILIAGGMR